jgi:hypothetical protein
MNCLECASATHPRQRPAIGCCAYCSVSVCFEHAAITRIRPQPVGVVLAPKPGRRKLTCVVCTPRPGYTKESSHQRYARGVASTEGQGRLAG